MAEIDTPLSIRFSPETRARMKSISEALAYSESHFVNLCVEAILEMAWKAENNEIPQIVKLLKAGMEETIRADRLESAPIEAARSRVFELADAEGISPEFQKALKNFNTLVESQRRKTIYSEGSVARRSKKK